MDSDKSINSIEYHPNALKVKLIPFIQYILHNLNKHSKRLLFILQINQQKAHDKVHPLTISNFSIIMSIQSQQIMQYKMINSSALLKRPLYILGNKIFNLLVRSILNASQRLLEVIIVQLDSLLLTQC